MDIPGHRLVGTGQGPHVVSSVARGPRVGVICLLPDSVAHTAPEAQPTRQERREESLPVPTPTSERLAGSHTSFQPHCLHRQQPRPGPCRLPPGGWPVSSLVCQSPGQLAADRPVRWRQQLPHELPEHSVCRHSDLTSQPRRPLPAALPARRSRSSRQPGTPPLRVSISTRLLC